MHNTPSRDSVVPTKRLQSQQQTMLALVQLLAHMQCSTALALQLYQLHACVL